METIKSILPTIKGWLEILGPAGPWVFALLIIIVGYFLAKFISKLVRKGLSKTSFDDKIANLLGQSAEGCERGIATFVFYLLMLFVVVFALSQAGQEDAVAPLKNILDQILGFIPKVLAAGVIGFVAWIIATLVKNVLTGALTASKVDERLGLGESKPITNGVGMLAFFGIILMMLPVALGALQMKEISEPISSLVGQIFDYVPALFSGIILIAIGYLVATIVRKVLSNVLHSIGTDDVPAKLGYKGSLPGGKGLSEIIGIVVMATILVTIAAQAISSMKLSFISDLAEGFVPGYYKILAAIIIFCVALFVANIVGGLISNPFWSKVARIAIIVILGASALQKANISNITNDTFQLAITAAVIAAAFAAGVGGAIALGLGGREKASSWLAKWKS